MRGRTPTAGLPELVGGELHWGRYTWIPDASFSVHALLGPGLTDGAMEMLDSIYLADRHRYAGPASRLDAAVRGHRLVVRALGPA